MIKRFIIVLLALTPLCSSLSAGQKAPFAVGEEIEYVIRALGINAARHVMKVTHMTNINGRDAYVIFSKLQTFSIVESIYPMHDITYVCVDAENFQTLKVVSTKTEGSWHDRTHITVVPERSVIEYQDRKGSMEIPYEEPIVDLVGMLYYGRALDFEVGKRYSFSIIDYRKIKVIKARVALKESRYVSVVRKRKVDLLKIQALGDSDVAIWLTDDEWRIPVKVISMKIRLAGINVGNLQSLLTEYVGPGLPSKK